MSRREHDDPRAWAREDERRLAREDARAERRDATLADRWDRDPEERDQIHTQLVRAARRGW